MFGHRNERRYEHGLWDFGPSRMALAPKVGGQIQLEDGSGPVGPEIARIVEGKLNPTDCAEWETTTALDFRATRPSSYERKVE